MSTKPWWQGPRGEWYVVIQFVLFALVAFGPRRFPGMPTIGVPWSTVSVAIGLLLGFIGAAIILLGLFNLGTNLSPLPHPKDSAQLVQGGAYSIVRHPIYSGIVLGSFGLAFLRVSPLVAIYALILLLFFDIKSRREEKYLALKFAEYPAYQKRVSKLIPFIY